MRHAWSALAQNSFVDRETGLISLISIVEQITGLPLERQTVVEPPETIPISVHLVSQFWRSDPSLPERGSVRVRIHGAEGQRADLVECDVDLSSRKRANIILKINGLPYLGQGEYEFDIEESADGAWRHLASIPLEVRLRAESDTSHTSST